jgi:hypothetical protein
MHALKTLPGILIFVTCVSSFAQVRASNVRAGNPASSCGQCHAAQAKAQPLTPMARAIEFIDANPTLKTNPKMTFRREPYAYTVETVGSKSSYSVTDGTNTISLPILWSFGAGGQTWILQLNGQLYESLVSYYPNLSGLDITIGDERITPHNLEEAMGRKLGQGEVKACFGCHATHAVSDRKLTLDTLDPGVTCEHCHVGSSVHLADAIQGDLDTTPPKLGKLSTEDLSNFCGQCHRTWEGVVRGHFHGEINVRFQPYRLANSRCFDGTDPRISCLACHDPHQDLVRQDSFYDSKCLACHAAASSAAAHAAPANIPSGAKTCPVAQKDCVSCHMPKINLPGGHAKFTDHEIRIVRPGDPYPN